MVQNKLGEQFAEHRSHDEAAEIGSDRSFGIVFTVFFAIIGGLPLISGEAVRLWALATSGAFFLIALVMPKALHPLNVVWMKFGALLNSIVSPLVLGMLFFLTITPIGVVMRLFGADLLRLRFDKSADSYWIKRDPPGPPPESMTNQF